MNLPKLDTNQEQQEKRFSRSKPVLFIILDSINDIECELSMLSDYLEEDDLTEAKNSLRAAYCLIRDVANKRNIN